MVTSPELGYNTAELSGGKIDEMSHFAMRHLIFLLLFVVFFNVSGGAMAAPEDMSVYTVTDVATDVTADSAAKARDQAVAQAQRQALDQLFDRLGAPANLTKKLKDDDIATLVKSFEVQNERASAVRYLGAFTIHFKPNAVRTYLGKHNATFDETRGEALLVLPVTKDATRAVLWEDKTKWHSAWDSSAANAGIVPVIIPSGGLEDIALISTAEALQGKSSAIKAIIDKYQAHGAVVAVLTGDITKAGAPLSISLTHFDENGATIDNADIAVDSLSPAAGSDTIMAQAVQKVRRKIEKDWRMNREEKPVEVFDETRETKETEADSYASEPDEPTTHLPVTVAINSLPEWAQIRRKLSSLPQIVQVEVIALQRGSSNIEIEFYGSIDALQLVLNQQGFALRQDRMNKVWMLLPLQVGIY